MENISLWSTVIGKGKFKTEGLANYILSKYDMSNPPNDLQEYNIFEEDNELINEFRKEVMSLFRQYIIDNCDIDIEDYDEQILKGWITGYGKNYSMVIHNHASASFSAVFYVLAEEDDKGGAIVFSDPRMNANRGYDLEFKKMFDPHIMQPETNDFVVFPSFVYHHVNPFYSQFRIAIPVDLYLEKKSLYK